MLKNEIMCAAQAKVKARTGEAPSGQASDSETDQSA